MKKTNKTVIVFLIVMFLLSFTNLLNIKIDGEVLKLSGLSVIIGVVAYFVTRKTNNNKNEGLNIKTIFKDFKDYPKAIYTFLTSISISPKSNISSHHTIISIKFIHQIIKIYLLTYIKLQNMKMTLLILKR